MNRSQNYIFLFFVLSGLLFALVLDRGLAASFSSIGVLDRELGGAQFRLSRLVAILIAGGTTFAAYRAAPVSGFAHEVTGELGKVTWPSREETNISTRIVVITVIVASFILFLFDYLGAAITGFVY